MRILFLTHAFNSLSQRLYVELTERGHEVSVEYDIHDAVTEEAVALFRPDLILAPYLKRAIPESVWSRHLCLVVHPGIPGDRGPSALDWAILEGMPRWGVTVLQANGELDGGDIWAAETFPMRAASKSSLYRNEVTEGAVRAVLQAIDRIEAGNYRPEPQDAIPPASRGRPRPAMRQAERAIDWQRDDTETVLRKIRSADGAPGVRDEALGRTVYLHGAHREDGLRGTPGQWIARRHGALCRATRDGAVWITHLREPDGDGRGLKLPAAMVLGQALDLPEVPAPLESHPGPQTWQDIRYEERNSVGYLHFDFHNAAMGTEQCRRLREAYAEVRARDTQVIVLMGGADFWSNGMDLALIEAAASPADESWRNINAMDDLVLEILDTERQLTIAALQGNAGAGGVFLALAADQVYARKGIVLNPHYKNMGNLYGSEYWTYLLPRRVGMEGARRIMAQRLPLGGQAAAIAGLLDECLDSHPEGFRRRVEEIAEGLAHSPDFRERLERKRAQRRRDEREKPLAAYREEELAGMGRNFYGFDPSYHVARYNFIYKVPHSRTPLHLAHHRAGDLGAEGALPGKGMEAGGTSHGQSPDGVDRR
ncbi:hydrogenase maturation protein [Acidithiobacillus sp.]